MTSLIASGTLLYGTCVISMPDNDFRSSAERCGVLPLPGEPYVSLPGCDLASAMSSGRFAASPGLVTRMFGAPAMIVTGTNAAGSKRKPENKCWLMAIGPGGEMSNV